MEQLTCPRPTTLCSRASPIEQATGDLEQPTSPGFTDQLQRYTRVNRPVSRTTVCPRSPDVQEQPVDQYRPMTSREEEIMRIHEDGIYCSPDMIEKSGGFWITSSSMKPGETCSLQYSKYSSSPISYSRTTVTSRRS